MELYYSTATIPLIVLFIVSAIAIVVYGHKKYKKLDVFEGITFIALIAAILTIASLLQDTHYAYNDGYKQGQIDALNGEYKYEMQTHIKTDTTYKELKVGSNP